MARFNAWDKIVITTDGKTTIAEYGDEKATVENAKYASFERAAHAAFALVTHVTNPKHDKPKRETIKLYCIKDLFPGMFLTKGKVYQYGDEGFNYDSPMVKCACYGSYEEWTKVFPSEAECLVPLVKRPAKVGEWALLDGETMPLQVIRICVNGCVVLSGERHTCHKEYLVLDGYQPKQEYYSGKVVCIHSEGSWFTVGKIYTINNGELHDETVVNHLNIESIKDLNDRFDGKVKFIPIVE